jgi:hypothetical protein
MRSLIARCLLLVLPLAFTATHVAAQDGYRVISVSDGGTISGNVKWSGPQPRELDFPVTKDAQICDPNGKKTVSLERLIVGSEGGVANTVVYLKNISAGKAMELPEQLFTPSTWMAPPATTCPFLSRTRSLRATCLDPAW